MPRVQEDKKPARKASIAVAVGLACVALVVIGGAVIWLKMRPAPNSTAPKTAAVLDTAQDKLFSNDADGAIAELTAHLKVAATNDEKAVLYMRLGVAYESKQDYARALEAFQKAAAIKAGYGTNDSIARIKAKMGDKAGAIEYYKRNVALINSGEAGQHYGDLPEVQENIRKLGGTP